MVFCLFVFLEVMTSFVFFPQEIRVYVNFDLDESYTPSKIAILAGTNYHDLQEVHVLEFSEEPKKWFAFPLLGSNEK